MILIIIGVLAGIISGMGIGGGTLVVPALTMFCGTEQLQAQGLNLLYFIPTATVALCSHVKNKRVETENLWYIIISGLILAVAGSFIALSLDQGILRKAFGCFLLLMGAWEILKKPR